MSERQSAENDAPWCKGSMRAAKRATEVGSTRWGLCTECRTMRPLALGGLTKPHQISVTPPIKGV